MKLMLASLALVGSLAASASAQSVTGPAKVEAKVVAVKPIDPCAGGFRGDLGETGFRGGCALMQSLIGQGVKSGAAQTQAAPAAQAAAPSLLQKIGSAIAKAAPPVVIDKYGCVRGPAGDPGERAAYAGCVMMHQLLGK